MTCPRVERLALDHAQIATAWRWRFRFLCLIGVVAFIGCGDGASDGKYKLSGTVSLDGVLMAGGTISFAPKDNSNQSSGAVVKAGAYDISAKKGLKPGEYLVRIYGAPVRSMPAGMTADELMSPTVEQAVKIKAPKQPVPASYNSASEQVIEVTAAGPNVFNFDIDSKK